MMVEEEEEVEERKIEGDAWLALICCKQKAWRPGITWFLIMEMTKMPGEVEEVKGRVVDL